MPDPFSIDVEDSLMRFKLNDPHFVEKISKEIPAFVEFEHTHVKSDVMRRRVFSWVTLMYDPNSPLRREVKDLYKRKVYAGNLVGLRIHFGIGKYKKWVEDFFTGQNENINQLVVKYIASFSSPEYMQLVGHVAMLEKSLQLIISGGADKNVQAMFDLSTEKVKQLEGDIYGVGEDQEVSKARRALYQQVAFDISEMRPENVARTVASGEDLPGDWGPYANDYVPDEIYFAGDDPKIAEADEE